MSLLNLIHLTVCEVLNCNNIRSIWAIDARSIYQFVKINCTCINILGYNFVYFLIISPGGNIKIATCDFGVDNFLAAFSINFLPASIASHQQLSFQYLLLQFLQPEELPTLIALPHYSKTFSEKSSRWNRRYQRSCVSD